MPTLTPDLFAASRAAWQVHDRAASAAASSLVTQIVRWDGGVYRLTPDPQRAVQAAREAQAAAYEAHQLHREAAA